MNEYKFFQFWKCGLGGENGTFHFLQTIVFMYIFFLFLIIVTNIGDDIWRYVGKLTEAQRSMLDDRFKWKVCTCICCPLYSYFFLPTVAHLFICIT